MQQVGKKGPQDKDKKIGQLRELLGKAKNKITDLKNTIAEKDKAIQDLKAQYQKKIKNLHSDEGQIMKQYEQRLIRYQKSLQDSDNMVAKYQKLSQNSNNSYEQLAQKLTAVSNLIAKNFSQNPTSVLSSKQSSPPTSSNGNSTNNEAIEELCNLEKCKEFCEKMQAELQKSAQNSSQLNLTALYKGIAKIVYLYQDSLKHKRQSRLIFLKKESKLQKSLEQEVAKHSSNDQEVDKLKQELTKMQQKYEKKLQLMAKSKLKQAQEQTNVEFIKQLFIKVLVGPKSASLMAFEVLSKVLKFTPQEHQTYQKKIK